jgi:preprotein translocase subunit SecD
MDRKIRWRTFWLSAAVILSACMLIPTLVPSESQPRWFNAIFSKKIQLGLDLQGGLYIVYSIDLDKAVDDKASEILRDFEAKMAEQDVKGKVTTPRQPIGAVTITLDDPAAKSRIDSKFLSDYDEIIEPLECPAEQRDNSLCFRVSPEYADGIRKSAQDQSVITIRDRIDKRGVAEPSVKSKGEQIVVELPGLREEEIERVKDLIGRTAKLEFKMVEDGSEYMRKLYAHVNGDARAKELKIEVGEDVWSHDESGRTFNDYYLRAEDYEEWLPIAEAKERNCWNASKTEREGKVQCNITGRQRIESYLQELAQAKPELAIDDNHQMGYEHIEPEAIANEDTREPFWRTLYLRRPVELSGSSIADSYKYWDPTTNRPAVLVVFNRYGARRFGDMTSQNVGKKMAIILDETVNSAPVIQDAITGGRSTITMGGSTNQQIEREADDLVSVLKTGSLPAPLKEESAAALGPTLGSDAVSKAWFSFILGSGLVLLVMIYVYRFSGFLSILALALNILFMLAVLAGLAATLTLPGIAATVLTVGMAVDANIIIYERIREELRAGKSIRGAVDAGFSRAFAAILDGQLTTAVAGYVLLQYGSGPIRGFAVMLIIGIVTTLFTTTWCTRLLFDHYLGRGRKVTELSI